MAAVIVYLVCAVAAFMIGRKIGVSLWLRIVLAWLGPIGLLGTLIGLLKAWQTGVPIVAEKADSSPPSPQSK